MRILVVGERFTDRYFIGTCTRLSPEAPIPVVAIKEVIQFAGGAANVSANFKALGVEVREMYQPGHYPIKNRLMGNDTMLARWDQDDTCEPLTGLNVKLQAYMFKDIDAVVISDYNKGMFTPEGIAAIGQHIPDKTPVFIDTKASPTRFSQLGRRPWFFPNMKEWVANSEAYTALKNVVRTESENGVTLVGDCHVSSYATNIVSVSGAGDTAVAAFAYAYLSDAAPEDCLRFAMQACAVVCSKPYTATATLDEIHQTRT